MKFPIVALTVALIVSSTMLAASDFADDSPVTFVIPYGPGGGFDTTVRVYAPGLAKVLETPVSPLNVAGASGIRGAKTVYRATPDGSLIGIFNIPGLLTSEFSGVDLGFDLNEISWIATLGSEPQGVVVAGESEFRSLTGLCASGRPVSLSSTGPLSTGGISAKILFDRLGCSTKIVYGYQGSAESAVAVMRGDVDATVMPLSSSASLVTSGDLRMIFTLTDEPVLDGVQTAADIGHPELGQLAIRRVVGGPSGMDPDIVMTFEEAFRDVSSTPDVRAWKQATGLTGEVLGSAETTTMLKDVAEILEAYRDILTP